jgi:hypothetical protein
MSHPEENARIETRAELLPEESAVGSEVPLEQASVILEESDRRTEDPEGTQHEYTQTPDEGR